jgi:glycosyltransferase involved in cell wall biosynthesis
MQNVSERMVNRGHRVKVIATNAYSTEDYFLPGKGKKRIQDPETTLNGVEITRVSFTRTGAGLFNLLRRIGNYIPYPCRDRIRMKAWGPRSREYSRRILDTQGFDLIAACPLPTLNIWYAWKASRKLGLPLIIIPCFHTEDPWTFNNRWYFHMLAQADAVIALTDEEQDYLRQTAGLNPQKIHTLGVGIDFTLDGADIDTRKKYGIKHRNVVLFLGQHGAHKGITDLVQAMRLVWKRHDDVALVIAGNPTDHTHRIRQAIQKLPSDQREKITLIEGFPEAEKRPLMQLADVFVSVSAFESFGIVFLEAWREKIPVIGCRKGGAARLIQEFEDGLKVQAGKIPEIAGALDELLQNADSRRRMGENGYRKAVEHYSWENLIPKWENLYTDVLRNR